VRELGVDKEDLEGATEHPISLIKELEAVGARL
jgi:hypothetical protein